MAIQGVITGRDVLLHGVLIAREFGLRTLLRCVRAILLHERTTFLALAFEVR